ncbi:MAG TPA: serine/threonine-protein kinase [Polyangia bacterium]|jgi:serine/threonine-protein kinase|nr:serine/threonine-protein kinase [Polyangia bacterium]
MIGESIGSYRIVAKLGEGGMGAVYLGEHQHIARKAAIKVLLPEFSANQQIVARFFNEARATSLIRHPGIVEILDCSVLPNGNAYIVMEFLSGESLGGHLRDNKQPLPPSRALFLARHIADALAAAHDQRIVHRDLKPDNVFLMNASEAAPIKILDFGIAKLMFTGSQEGHYKTRTGSIMGTPVYMSPEQCRGAGEVDHRTDIYSLGCILFEMLCGRPPFTFEGFGELIHAHLATVPPRARSIEASVPAAADALVARLLAKSPDERPQTMRDLVAELDAIAGAYGSAVRVSDRPVASRPVAQTIPLPSNARQPETPPVKTTLGSATGERGVTNDAPIPRTRSRWPLAVVALAGIAGAVGLWMKSLPANEMHPGGPAAAAAAPAPTPVPTPAPAPAPAPAAVPAPPTLPPNPIPAPIPTAAPAPSAAAPVAVRVAAAPTAPAPKAARKVKVVITSDPAGADICLAKDHRLLGKTKLEWSADRSSRSTKLLVRKRGYRGQEISVETEHDAQKQITLHKLGPDDLDDTDNCERR